MPSEITESIVYTPSDIDAWSTLNFVAPANGFVGMFISPQGDGNSMLKLQQRIDGDFDKGLTVSSTSQKSSSRVIGCYMPVSKGEVIRLSSLYMNVSTGTCVCHFVYSVGEAKRLGLI